MLTQGGVFLVRVSAAPRIKYTYGCYLITFIKFGVLEDKWTFYLTLVPIFCIEWIPRLPYFSAALDGFPRFTSGVTPADLLAAAPFWSTYLQTCKQLCQPVTYETLQFWSAIWLEIWLKLSSFTWLKLYLWRCSLHCLGSTTQYGMDLPPLQPHQPQQPVQQPVIKQQPMHASQLHPFGNPRCYDVNGDVSWDVSLLLRSHRLNLIKVLTALPFFFLWFLVTQIPLKI